MTDTVVSSIQSPDGTQIPIDWVYPDAPQYEWLLEREHWPGPMTPMEKWIWQNGVLGGDRAWEEIDMEPPVVFSRFQLAGPFLYARMTMPPPEKMAAMLPRYLAVGAEYGGALGLWKKFCEPRIQRSCEELEQMPSTADPRTAAELLFYGFHQTFTCLGLMFIPNMQLSALLTEHNVPDAELTGFELTQGGANATQAVDEEIWNLAELARKTPAVNAILQAPRDNALARLRDEPAARAFMAAFDELLQRHGRRSQGWALSAETWHERPDTALALVQAQVGAERVSPQEWRERTAARRQEATARVLDVLPEGKHEELRRIVNALDGYVNIREGRAYWQLVISGAARGWLLRIGEGLAKGGRVERADDIFFMTPDDYSKEATSDLRRHVAGAREEWERWRQFAAPLVIGTPGAAVAEVETRRAEHRGSPASRGQVTGRARILRSIDDGSRLQHGEILVASMTTPAWTPLFAIAGGIVTETGGALSHPAITAREYGIPAVVALDGAMTLFNDGQLITVDGSAGMVTVAAGD
jgi:pyruvate,water dikinase